MKTATNEQVREMKGERGRRRGEIEKERHRDEHEVLTLV